MVPQKILFAWNGIYTTLDHRKRLANGSNIYFILGDPGSDSGGEGKSKRATKKIGEEKSRARARAPGDKVLPGQFQTVGVLLASDWCQKIFVFFCPITGQLARSPFRVLLHGRVHEVNTSAIFSLLAHQKRRALFVEKLKDKKLHASKEKAVLLKV